MTPLVSFGMFLVLVAVSCIGLAVAVSISLIAATNWLHARKERASL